jgi:hypothetical protein
MALFVAMLGGLGACPGADADPPEAGTGGCWPPSLGAPDAAVRHGCTPRTTGFALCETPITATMLRDGALVVPDGAPAGNVCNGACGVNEYTLMCNDAVPDRALHCTPIPIRGNDTFYCCICPSDSP